jgi:hypothetical protein
LRTEYLLKRQLKQFKRKYKK